MIIKRYAGRVGDRNYGSLGKSKQRAPLPSAFALLSWIMVQIVYIFLFIFSEFLIVSLKLPCGRKKKLQCVFCFENDRILQCLMRLYCSWFLIILLDNLQKKTDFCVPNFVKVFFFLFLMYNHIFWTLFQSICD